MIQSNCYASFQEIVEAYKQSSFWEDLTEGSKIAYRKSLERLLALSSEVNSSYTTGFAMQMPVAVARSRSLDRDEWNRAIRSLELSNNEKNKLFIVLNRVYEGAGLPKMGFKPLPHEVKETIPYSKEEIEAWWAVQMPIELRVAVAFLRWCFWSGMRPWCEALPMEWIVVTKTMVLVLGGKRREKGAVARCLNILTEMQECLDFIKQMMPAPRNRGLIWIAENGRALTKGCVALRLREAARHAGVPYRQIYDARRGLATEMLRSGYSLEETANQLGHKRLETTRRYDQRTKEEKALNFKGLPNGKDSLRQTQETGQAPDGRAARA
jgi:site-specific recombinase XerC